MSIGPRVSALFGETVAHAETNPVEGRVCVGRIETLIRQQPVALVVNLLNSVLLAVVLSTVWPVEGLTVWVAAVWAAGALRTAFWWRYRGELAGPAEARRASGQFMALACVSGLIWGMSGVLFLPDSPMVLQGFIVFVLGGMSAGAVGTMSSHMPGFCAFVALTLLPTIGRLFIEGGLLYVTMGVMGLVYVLALVVTARNQNRTLSDSLALQFEKSDLIEELSEACTRAKAANIAKSTFVANVSHELRTPLNAIIGFSEIIQKEVFGPTGHQRYREYAQDIFDSGKHLLSLINDILDLSKIELDKYDLQEQWINLTPMIEDSIRMMRGRADDEGVILVHQPPFELPDLYADPRAVKQILLNLISNAVKFTNAGGCVGVQAFPDEAGCMFLSITDTGIGMTQEEVITAMAPFGQIDSPLSRKYDGTGLGLPLVKRMIDLHEGSLEIESAPGTGTRIILRFPPDRLGRDPQVPCASQFKPETAAKFA